MGWKKRSRESGSLMTAVLSARDPHPFNVAPSGYPLMDKPVLWCRQLRIPARSIQRTFCPQSHLAIGYSTSFTGWSSSPSFFFFNSPGRRSLKDEVRPPSPVAGLGRAGPLLLRRRLDAEMLLRGPPQGHARRRPLLGRGVGRPGRRVAAAHRHQHLHLRRRTFPTYQLSTSPNPKCMY